MAYLELNDTKNNIIHKYSSNKDWFKVKLNNGKIISFILFKHLQDANNENTDAFSNEYNNHVQYLKHLKISTNDQFKDEMTVKALDYLKKNSSNKAFKFDKNLIESLLNIIKQQILSQQTEFNRDNMYLPIQIIYNFSNYNAKFNMDFQSNDNTLPLLFDCLKFFIKIADKRLVSNVVYIIYFLSKKSHITSIQTKWKECQCFDNLLKILNDNLESLTDPIIERIVCTLKVSYDLYTETTNEEKDANDEYLFNNEQTLVSSPNKTNIYKYFKEIVFEEESILKNRMFRDAFIHFINMFDGIETKFDDLIDSNRKIVIETLTNFTKFIMDLLAAELVTKIRDKNQIKLIKLFGYLIDTLNLSINLSFESNFLCENYQKLNNGLPLLIQFIANDMTNVSKENKIIYFLLYERVYLKILTLITLFYEYTNNHSALFDWNNLETLEKFVKSTLKMRDKEIVKSLKIILFQYDFKHKADDLDDYKKYFLSDDSFKLEKIENSIAQLLLIDEIAKIFEKRTYLNAILYLFNDDRFFASLSCDTQKEFIKFSVDFFEYVLDILNNLPKDPQFDHSFVYSIKVLLYFDKLIQISTEISNRSDQFCLEFHRNNSKNGILILFKLLTHENTFSYSVGSKNQSNKIYNILTNELINNVLHLLLNLSRVSYDFKCIWNDSVDSLVILKELALKLSNNINKTFELLCFMTISNIASDDDILKIASENSHVIKSIVQEVSILAIMLKNNSAERIEIKLNEQNSVRIISNYISGWHLIEVIKDF
jgi:hypothetical protein